MATDNKYDRQLRLWGSNGQKALSECCVVLINASAVGTETLKNLVLPGVGSFHIIDDHLMEGDGDGDGDGNINGSGGISAKPFSNFFVFPKAASKESKNNSVSNRAEIAMEHLSELNPDVKGKCTHVPSLENADYASILKSISDQNVTPNIIVIAADLPPPILRTISSLCWNGHDNGNDNGNRNGNDNGKSIPLLIVKSYGLIGSVRVQTPYHPIIESKPDNTKPDLRLAFANVDFPELYQLATKVNLKTEGEGEAGGLDSKQHSHVPYVIILLQALDQWRSSSEHGNANGNGNDKKLPKTLEEKNAFKKIVKSMSTNWGHELNFIEADENAYLAYTTLEIPWEVEGLLDSVEDAMNEKAKGGVSKACTGGSGGGVVSSFDVLLLTLKRFMKANRGFPPLDGSIPDMTASTQGYIELQGIYKAKAEKDKDEMNIILSGIVEEYNGNENITIPDISNDELATFCKNIFNLRLTKTRSYLDECEVSFQNEDEKDEILGEVASLTFDPYEVPEHTPLLWYIALRACDAFYDEHGYYPGRDSRALALESDAVNVQKHIVDIVKKLRLEENELIQSTLLSTEEDKKLAFAKEMTRYHNAELHNIASVIGGVASQEAVKLITGQYVPMDGNYIFNGIVSVAGVCKL